MLMFIGEKDRSEDIHFFAREWRHFALLLVDAASGAELADMLNRRRLRGAVAARD